MLRDPALCPPEKPSRMPADPRHVDRLEITERGSEPIIRRGQMRKLVTEVFLSGAPFALCKGFKQVNAA